MLIIGISIWLKRIISAVSDAFVYRNLTNESGIDLTNESGTPLQGKYEE